MAQGKGGGQDSSGVDGMGPDAFGGTGGAGDTQEGQVSSYGGDARSVQEQAMNEAMAIGAQRTTAMDVDYSAYENTQFSPSAAASPVVDIMGSGMDEWGYAGQKQGVTLDDTDYDDDLGFATPSHQNIQALQEIRDVKQEMQFDFKNFYSALDDPDASLESKDLEIRGFINHISRKNYTDQGFFSKLGLLGSKLNQRQQIEQIENFMAKSGTQKSIEALNKAYSAQINENPGFRSFLPGYTAINALMTAIGLPGQHTHPAVKALYDKMEKLGMIERTRPEQESWTEAQKKAHCEAKEGWSWDSKLQACVKGGQKMLYNVHTGQYDIPPI